MSGKSSTCTATSILHPTVRSMSPSSPSNYYYPSSRRVVTMRPLVGTASPSSNVINPSIINGSVGVPKATSSTASASPLALFTAAARSVITANSIVRCVKSRHECRAAQQAPVTRKVSADRADKVRSDLVLGSAPIVGTLVHNSKTVSRNSAPVQSTFIQCSGHEDAFDFTGVSNGTILKKVTSDQDNEVIAYEQLMSDPTMADFVPKFFRTVSRSSSDSNNCGGGNHGSDTFIELEDLLYKFATSCSDCGDTVDSPIVSNDMGPFVMDIKMGTRTFLESEVTNSKLRSDLYEKMVKINPLEPTEEERKIGAVTKLRYMTFRESMSSSSTLGFRIEGVQPQLKQMIGKEYQLLKEESEIFRVLNYFLKSKESLRQSLINQLIQLRKNFVESKFFRRHEVIGSSLLIIHDGSDNIGVWMIDFAKTVPTNVSIDHTTNWTLGNHEDGYLFGLDNLIRVIQEGKM